MEEKKATKILLVDDDLDIQEFMTYNLKKENFKVYNAYNGKEAIAIAKEKIPDLIILDIMMPGMSGIEVCHKLREEKRLEQVLICFLTARGEDYTQIEGFDAGADDYITKPISPKVFIKKVDALLRRADKVVVSEELESFESDELKVNYVTRQVHVRGKEVVLAKKEFALLSLLLSKPGKVFTRDEIYISVWGNDIIVGDRTIDVHIRKLREKIGDEYITTFKGIGYKISL
jgi:two-component system alkaline phosphatase synthesis response regulator PhoP